MQIVNLANCHKATTCSAGEIDAVSSDRPWGAREECGNDHEGQDERNRQRERDQWHQEDRERRPQQHPSRPEPEHRHTSAHEPDRIRREHCAPARGAAEVLLRNRRAEDVHRAGFRRVDDRELEDDSPEPRA